MLDLKFVRENLDAVRTMLENRHNSLQLDGFTALEERRRSIIGEVESLKGERNTVSKKISEMKRNGENADITSGTRSTLTTRTSGLAMRLTVTMLSSMRN